MKKNDGGPAFPAEVIDRRAVHYDQEKEANVFDTQTFSGMTLRDWFAGRAMEGTMQHKDIEFMFNGNLEDGKTSKHEQLALACYIIADAMIAERDKV